MSDETTGSEKSQNEKREENKEQVQEQEEEEEDQEEDQEEEDQEEVEEDDQEEDQEEDQEQKQEQADKLSNSKIALSKYKQIGLLAANKNRKFVNETTEDFDDVDSPCCRICHCTEVRTCHNLTRTCHNLTQPVTT